MDGPKVTARLASANDSGCMCYGCDAERRYVIVIEVNGGNLISQIRLCVVHGNELSAALDGVK